MIIEGKYTNATVYSTDIEQYAVAQLQKICDNPVSAGSTIRVMPDVHPGKVGPIGLTMTVTDKVMPSLLGVDIGCGMLVAKLKIKGAIEFKKLDAVIRDDVPFGSAINSTPHRFAEEFEFERLKCYSHIDRKKAIRSIGSLGLGNHFLEIDKGDDGYYLVIHTGSRHLGVEVTEWYLKEGNKLDPDCPYVLTTLSDNLMEDYLHDVLIVQEYAALNRRAILDGITKGMKWKVVKTFESVHNYIGTLPDGTKILRKGAISAAEGQQVVIPINMRDGVILGTGKGNPDWNYSAPHGSGRLYKRDEVKNHFTTSQFKKEMEGIYSSCIGPDTLDEAPFAYRDINTILDAVKDTVDVDQVLKPVYNFKAGGR